MIGYGVRASTDATVETLLNESGKTAAMRLSVWTWGICISSLLVANHLNKLMEEHYKKAVEIYNAGIING
jgi:hypothetical protein